MNNYFIRESGVIKSFPIKVAGIAMMFLLAMARICFAQDTIKLAGDWKIQPATLPSAMPDAQNWGSVNIDNRVNWNGKGIQSGKGTRWENTPHDSINSVWYERKLDIPKTWEKQNVVVDFRRVEGDAIIFVNNKCVAELLRPGGTVNLTSFIEFGKANSLDVFITRDYTGISRGFEQDVLRYRVRKLGPSPLSVSQWPLGITAPVCIISHPAQAVTDAFCISSYRKKQLTFEVEISSDSEQDNDELQADIFDQNNKAVLTIKSDLLKLVNGKATYRITAPWANPICWELDKPYLYKARVALLHNGKQMGQFKNVSFGFREIWMEGKGLMMNGHPSHWRLTELYGANKNGLSVYRQVGYNVGQVQPASNLWWGANQDTPLMDEEMLDEMDRIGMGCTLPAPSVVILRSSMLDDIRIREAYRQEAEYYIKKYRNHPCVLGWAVSMNSANPKFAIWAQGMGRQDSSTYSQQQKVIQLACNIVKEADPTRLAFSHADGSVGDMSTANVYLNFVPLQEREEWPKEWAKSGNMPYSAVEFGPPYWNNFWKGNQFLLTEYLSMYLGDKAYQTEKPDGLKSLIDFSTRPLNGLWEQVDFKQFPSFWDFQTLFTRNTNRAWRTWGVNGGWLQWILEGYGDPPGPKKRFTDRYKLSAPITQTPEWANPRFSIFQQGNKPLLTYIAGYPVHTDKTHTFYSGEKFQKQIAVIWDGAGKKELNANWVLKQDDRVIQQGKQKITATTGETKLLLIQLTAPVVLKRTSMQLLLDVTEENGAVTSDTLALSVFPAMQKLPATTKVFVFDPIGKTTAWLNTLGVRTQNWAKGNSNKTQVLIIGREALKPGDALPYTEQDLANGLHVIVMEQRPEVWKGMGFETTETMPRYTYIRDHNSWVLSDIKDEDMINWRGTPDLLPEGKSAFDYDMLHAPKWTNTHAVASIALKTPETIGFTPLLQTEFDMAYSPLLEFKYGKGKVTYCTLDLTDRVGNDPVATLLARNLVVSQSTSSAGQNEVCYSGGEKGAKLLAKLGIIAKQITVQASGIWVVDSDATMSQTTITNFAAKGGIVLYLPQTAEKLRAQGFAVSNKIIYKIQQPDENELLRGIGPNMLRWRDALNVVTFNASGQPAGCKAYDDGIIMERKTGKGKQIWLQVSPDMLEGRYPDAREKAEAVQLSVIRLTQLTAQLLTNLGAHPNKETAQRLTTVSLPPQFQTLGTWKVLGPYLDNTSDQKKTLETPYPGEQDAIDGGENPNPTYKTKEGKMLDWRKTVSADAGGFVDLSKAFNGIDENAIAYVTKAVTCEFAQTATLRLGVDFWMNAWVNGKPVLQVIKNHSKHANEYVLNVPLRKGENIITLKIVSGRGGFGFWANMAYNQDKPSTTTSTQVQEVSFYSPLYKFFDPYQFAYW
jgi:beta-galactosidase